MENKVIIHQNRAIIEVRGLDRKKFLQGLITNDVEKASASNLIYAAMLSPQGRFLYDFFIFEIGESLILDCFKPRRDEILQKLKFYKLRSKVEIVKNDELLVAQILGVEKKSHEILRYTQDNNLKSVILSEVKDLVNQNPYFPDPRNESLGYRVYFPCHPREGGDQESSKLTMDPRLRGDDNMRSGNDNVRSEDDNVRSGDNKGALEDNEYNFLRISRKIPESELDLTYDKSFILEFDFDNLNAIDYQKGCYVGQELTARTHYRGEIRKKLLHVTIDNLREITKSQEFSCEGKSAGIVLSSVFHNNELHALALIKLENPTENPAENIVAEIKNLELEKNKITVIS